MERERIYSVQGFVCLRPNLRVQINSRADYFDCFQRLAVHLDFQSALYHLFHLQASRVCVSLTTFCINVLKCWHISYESVYSSHERDSLYESDGSFENC